MHFKLNLSKLFLFILTFSAIDSAKILIYIIQGSYSMLNIIHPYGVKLLEDGHQVTLLSSQKYKIPHPNITYVIPSEIWKYTESQISEIGAAVADAREKNIDIDGGYKLVPPGGINYCRMLLDDPVIIKWIDEVTFDLVVVDSLFNDCGIGLAWKWKTPFIYFETTTILPWEYDTFGFDPANSWIPDIRSDYSFPMTFFQRVYNTIRTLEMYFMDRQYDYLTTLDGMLRDKLNIPEMPSLKVLERNASLILTNSHFSAEFARSLPPMVIQIGGLQCEKDDKPLILPKNMEEFVSKYDGFIYVSFGSLCKLSEEMQTEFLKSFKNQKFSKIGFIMRWTDETIPTHGVPANVLLTKWAPQKELLAHPKIKGFCSHGGMLSTQEAVFYGVPGIIGIPVFAEQEYNVECLKRLGAAIKLDFVKLTADKLIDGFNQILNNPSYALNMKKLSSLHHDRPMHPADTALYWTNYVLRHHANGNGLDHLKPLGIHQYWFQRRLLDVWGFIALSVLSAVFLILFILKKIISLLLCKKSTVSKKKKS